MPALNSFLDQSSVSLMVMLAAIRMAKVLIRIQIGNRESHQSCL